VFIPFFGKARPQIRLHACITSSDFARRAWRTFVLSALLTGVFCGVLSPALAAAPIVLPDAVVGDPYNQTATIPSGGTCDIVGYEYPNVDPGFVLTPVFTDPTNCSFTLTGSPRQTGVSTLTTKLYDAGYNVLSVQDFTITARAAVSTSIALTASASTSVYGASLRLTANLAGTHAGSGTVTFKDGGTALGTVAIAGYTATLDTSALAVGLHSITAVFNGDSTTSSAQLVEVTRTSPSVSLSASSSTVPYATGLTLRATLSGGVGLSGSVEFREGTTLLGTGTVSGSEATLLISSLSVGGHSITATYVGDSNNSSAISLTAWVVVTQATSTISLTSDATSVPYGYSLGLRAQVTGAASPGGMVTFMEGANTLGTGAITGGTASTFITGLAVGTHVIKAVYGGDTNNLGATSSTLTVTVTQFPAAVTLNASATSLSHGSTLALSATVNGTAPTGTVTFKDGTVSLGSVSVSGGRATLNVSTLAVGSHSLTAEYSGDTINAAANSAATVVAVGKATPSIVVAASAASVNDGVPVTLTATLSGGSAPSGTVTFKDGSTVLGSATISGASASYVANGLAVGNHSITATYNGDTSNDGLTSSAITVAVLSISPGITLISPASGPAAGGTRVTVNGANLAGATSVSFGGVAAQIVSNTGSVLVVTTPAHAAGSVDVRITTPTGSTTASGGYGYDALPDPAKNAAVTALISVQTQAVQQFAGAHLLNFNQRLESLHGDAGGASSFGLTFTSMARSNTRTDDEFHTKTGSALDGNVPASESWRTGLRKASLNSSTKRAQAFNGNEMASVAQSPEQGAMSWWVNGVLDVGQQKASGSQSGADMTSNGISFGGDYRVNNKWVLGLGGGFSRSHYVASDASVKSVGQGGMLVAYASVKPLVQTYVDAVVGVGKLNFDVSRSVTDTGALATGSRGGRMVFGSLTAGYEWRSEGWMLSPYGRIDTARSSLDGYTETSSGTGALTYFGQSVNSESTSLGLRGEMRYRLASGDWMPQARITYQHTYQGAGPALMAYADPALSSPTFSYAAASQENSQWLLSLGGRWLLRSGTSLSLMYTESLAATLISSKSLSFSLTSKF
jgi:trimeric autotransporter adhesin